MPLLCAMWYINNCHQNKVQITHCTSIPLSCPHKCNTTTVQLQYKIFFSFFVIFFYCTCVVPCNTTLQYKFSTTCRKSAGYLQQLGKNCIAVVLHLCRPLKLLLDIHRVWKKKSPQFSIHNFSKLTYIFVIFSNSYHDNFIKKYENLSPLTAQCWLWRHQEEDRHQIALEKTLQRKTVTENIS